MNGKKIMKMLFLAALIFGVTNINAAKKNKASVAVKTVALADFLDDISEAHEVFFTYNPAVISGSLLNPEEYKYNSLGKIFAKAS